MLLQNDTFLEYALQHIVHGLGIWFVIQNNGYTIKLVPNIGETLRKSQRETMDTLINQTCLLYDEFDKNM